MDNSIKFSREDVERYIKNNYEYITKHCNVSTGSFEKSYISGEIEVIPTVEVSFSVPIHELINDQN